MSEAVRLSAAAIGQSPPAPHTSFRAAIRERLMGLWPTWLARRAYRAVLRVTPPAGRAWLKAALALPQILHRVPARPLEWVASPPIRQSAGTR